MRRKIISVLSSVVCIALLTGCFGGKRESRFSADRFVAAMEESDTERYDSYPEMEEQLDNERALLAGMYAKLEEPSSSDTALEEYAFVRKLTDDEGAYAELDANLLKFETEVIASVFYEDRAGELEGAVSGEEDSLVYSYTVETGSRTAEFTAVYYDYDYVLILSGSEFKDNRLTELLDEFCPLFDMPVPDLSDVDCNAQIPSEQRMPQLIEEMGAEQIDAEEFSINWTLDEPGCFYVQTDDFVSISGVMDKSRLAMYDNVTHTDIFFSIDSVPEDLQASRYVVVRVTCDSEDSAHAFYDGIRDDIAAGTSHPTTIIGSGEEQGITYTKYKITDPYMSASYYLYYEGDAAYILSFLNMDEEVAADTIRNVCDIMCLP